MGQNMLSCTVIYRSDSHINKQLCRQQLRTVRRRVGMDLQILKWSVVEMVKQGRRIKGRKWVKESMRYGREGRERRKKIMKRGFESTSLLGCDAVRWASTTSVLSDCIDVASPRAGLRLPDPADNALRSCKSPVL